MALAELQTAQQPRRDLVQRSNCKRNRSAHDQNRNRERNDEERCLSQFPHQAQDSDEQGGPAALLVVAVNAAHHAPTRSCASAARPHGASFLSERIDMTGQ